MSFLEYNTHKLFYESLGEGNNPIIFIHGLCGNHRVWSKNIPAFADNNRVISIDMFGHGDSSNDISPKEAFESLPLALAKLIEQENLQNVVLVGHSIAGNILSSCIEQNIKNVTGYVFIDCAFNATQRVVDSRNKLADTLLGNPPDQLHPTVVNWYKTMMDMSADPKDNELILSALENIDKSWVLNFLKATNIIRQVPKTNLPVLIFETNWLTKDEPERSFYKVMPQADYVHWPVMHHFSFVYEAEKFNKQLQEFLDKYNFN